MMLMSSWSISVLLKTSMHTEIFCFTQESLLRQLPRMFGSIIMQIIPFFQRYENQAVLQNEIFEFSRKCRSIESQP